MTIKEIENFLFRIPDRSEELEDVGNSLFYTVNPSLIQHPDQLSRKIKDAAVYYKEIGPDFILETFDVFYFVIKFHRQVDCDVRKDAWILLNRAMSSLRSELDQFINKNFQLAQRRTFQNKLQMIVYPFILLSELYEEDDGTKTNTTMACIQNNQKPSKNNSKDKSTRMYQDYKNQSLSTLLEIFTLPLKRLFDPPHFLGNFINFSTRWIYKIIEKNSGARLRTSNYFHNMCEIITVALEKYQHSISYCMKIIEILQNRESSATILSDLVSHNIKHLPNMFIINDIIDQIKSIDISILSRDSSGPRAISSFLIELGTKCVDEMFKNISSLLEFLEQDSYLLRNATLEIITIIIIEKFRSPKIVKDVYIKNTLLDKLEDHIHDITSYTRSRVLHFWCTLAESKAIPIDRVPVVTELIIGRLQDKSCFVRKNAVHFLALMLKENPLNMMSRKDMLKTLEKAKGFYEKNQQLLKEILENHSQGEESDNDQEAQTLAPQIDDFNDDSGESSAEENESTETKNKKAKKRKSDEFASLNRKKYKLANDRETIRDLYRIWQELQKPLLEFWKENAIEIKKKLYSNLKLNLDKNLEDDLKTGLDHFRRLMIERQFEEAFLTLFALKALYPNEKVFVLKKSDYQNESDDDNDDDDEQIGLNGQVECSDSPIDISVNSDRDQKNYNDVYISAFTGFRQPILKLPYELTLAKEIFLEPLIDLGNSNIEAKECSEQMLVKMMDEKKFDQCHVKKEQLEMLIKRLQWAINVMDSIAKSVPTICLMLQSRNITDTQEAIRFFTHAYKMEVEDAFSGVQKMLVLIFTKEKTVRESLLEAFSEIYLNDNLNQHGIDQTSDNKSHYLQIKELSDMIVQLNQGELVCAETLIQELHKAKKFDDTHIKILWERYAMKHPNLKEEDSRSALIIIGMLASAQPSLIRNEIYLQKIIHISLQQRYQDYRLVADTCQVLLKAFKLPQTELAESFFKLPPTHLLFQRLSEILAESITVVDSKYWLQMCASVVKVIYYLAEKPDLIIAPMTKRCYERILQTFKIMDGFTENLDTNQVISSLGSNLESQESQSNGINNNVIVGSVNDLVMSHFISMLGCISANVLIHFEVHLTKELKIREHIKEKDKQTKTIRNRQTKKSQKGGKNSMNSTNSSTSINQANADDEEEDDEMNDMIGPNSNEDPFMENITKVCNESILYDKGILSRFTSLIERIAADYDGSRFSFCLRQASSLTLAKFMILSLKYTRQNRTILADILEKSKDASIRSNAVISFGDLLVRFPNEIEHFTGKIFGCLLDKDLQVKSNALKVLSRLILADMIKPKGNISKIAQLITDNDPSISSSAKLFFVELGEKNNVYNYLPDIISNLSGPNGMEEKRFQDMIKFLFGLLEKTRNAESLVTRLCQRFSDTSNERIWRDLSFCLSQLQYNDRAIMNLIDNSKFFADTLYCDAVFNNIITILNNVKKAGLTKPELKTSLEEMKSRMEQIRSKGANQNADAIENDENVEPGTTVTNVETEKIQGGEDGHDEYVYRC